MKYDHKKIEKKWQKFWEKQKLNSPDLGKAKKPFYNLMMFPYPSAEGLHVGNVYAFVHSDAYGRFMRLRGFDIFEPIGLDGFGIHSENYAIKAGEHILDVSKRTEKHFYEQLRIIGNQYDWTRRLETYKPDYYRWTQWIFVQMFKKGLAYQAESYVNWCPSCKTVLSDEQVISGKCERCESQVEKKMMKQWFFRITDYAGRLLKNLETINWSERTKIAQRNWIGKSEGATIKFEIRNSNLMEISNDQFPISKQFPNFNNQNSKQYIEVFTTRLDTIFGCTYCVLAPEHSILKNLESRIENYAEVKKYIEQAQKKSEMERTELAKEKTGVALKGIKAVSPFNQEEIQIFVADYVLGHYGTGAVMAVPAHDERDFEFAKKYGLEIKEVIALNEDDKIQKSKFKSQNYNSKSKILDTAFIEDGILVNSGAFSGLTSQEAREKMAIWLNKNNLGGRKIHYKLRDWCVSRQRYWGPPIPVIHCEQCGVVPVPEKDLPVLLPKTKDYLPRPDGLSPLARNEKFWKIKCPKCGGPAKRETDVSDTFLDSAWYFLRYPSIGAKNSELEIGNCLPRTELVLVRGKLEIPWNQQITRQWLPVDMYIGGQEHAVLHLLYSRFITMFFKDLGLIDFEEPYKRFFAHGLLISEGAKMSKSKGNVVNPDDYIKKYGADSVRLYLMFLGDVRQGGDWRDAGISGITRFVNRIWQLYQKMELIDCGGECKDVPEGMPQMLHKTIKKVTQDLEGLRFNTAISQMMIFVNFVSQFKVMPRDAAEKFLILLAPFAPHITEELWAGLGNKKSIFTAQWPEYNEAMVKDETIQMPVQINGKVRAILTVPADISEDEAKKLSMSDIDIQKWLAGKEPKKVIFVKGKLLNIVI